MYKLHKWTPSGKTIQESLINTIKELNNFYLVDRDYMEPDTKIRILENISDLTYLLYTMQKEELK
jgi:hypothetical protein